MTNIKVVEINGNKQGRTVAILAGVHGNEVCGINAFDSLIPKIKINSGKVIFIYANLEAIKQNKRFVEKDLNRCFLKEQPIDIAESLEGKTAKEIMPFLDKADAMLDIHASFTKDSSPFVICDEKWINEARIFNVNLVSYNWDKFHSGSTDYYMNLQDKVGICIECGYLADKKTVGVSERAIINFVKAADLIRKKPKKNKQKYIKIKSLYKNKFGLFRKAREFADFELLNNGELIGTDGKKEIFSKNSELVIFARDREKVGEECFLLAEEIKPDSINYKSGVY